MRTEHEMMDLILGVAKADDRIRAVLLVGSRANPNVPKDKYQDYDITYFVRDIKPFYNNTDWVNAQFGKPLIMQMPEIMRFPDGDGHFTHLMIFPDGNRIDLSFEFTKYVDDGEPAIALLDKDDGNGFIPPLPLPTDAHWHIQPPDELYYTSCCNSFWWCMNNVAKGIARDEIPYVMHMLNEVVREELHYMINWYIGVNHGFALSTGKAGKYFKRYLPPKLYAQYAATYSDGDYEHIWAAIDVMCDLFHMLALVVASHFGFSYRQEEEDGMREYLRMICVLPAPKPLNQITDEERTALFPVVLSEHNPEWKTWFADEKERLVMLVGTENIVCLSHIGSTSVLGLIAKPTVDILLEIADDADIDRLIVSLPSPEYICLNPPTMPTPPPHLMFLKGYTPTGFAERVFHIHVRYKGDWDELYFRDYLIAHPGTAAEYAALKRRLYKEYEYDRDGYTLAKGEFIRSVTEKARRL